MFTFNLITKGEKKYVLRIRYDSGKSWTTVALKQNQILLKLISLYSKIINDYFINTHKRLANKTKKNRS